MYNIQFLDSAYDDLDQIYNFCNNISQNYALKVRKQINKSINSLKLFPFASSLYFKNFIRKKIVYKRYLIIFTVISDTVFIYNIIDGRRNIKPTDLFKIPIIILSNFLIYSNYLSNK